MSVTGWRTNLAWAQFRMLPTPPPGETEDAQTEASIEPPAQVSVQQDGSQLKLAGFDVRVRLVSSGTWLVRGRATPSLLSHEQGHWDTAGLTAYEYYRALAALRAADQASLSQQAAETLQRIQTKVDALQEKYDSETDHSRNAAQQARWHGVISAAIGNNYAALPDP